MIQKAQRRLNIMGMPVIFDLPTPLAIKRTQEFINFVNPLLQAYCVKCHDGNYDGEFQLVPTKNRVRPDARRVAGQPRRHAAVDRPGKPREERAAHHLALRPHGNGPRKRSIFPGSNDKAYQILAAWVQSLKSPKDPRASARNQTGRVEPDSGEIFAVGRERNGNDNPEFSLPSLPETRRSAHADTPSSSAIPRPTPFGPHGTAPDGARQEPPDDFPLPFVITGKKPNLAPQPPNDGERDIDDRSSGSPSRRAISPNANARANLPQNMPATGSGKSGESAKGGTRPDTPKKKTKPVEIDPASSTASAP